MERMAGEREVAGRIEVVTDRPLILRRDCGALARVAWLVRRRPWLGVLAVGAGLLLLLGDD
jgi:hypothetical protein